MAQAQTELKNIERAIRLGMEKSPSLGCGFVICVGGATLTTGDYVALQTLDASTDTTLSAIVGDSGTGLVIPNEAVGTIIYMNFTSLDASHLIIAYRRCK